MGAYKVRFTVPEDVEVLVALEPTAFGYANNRGLQTICANALKRFLHSQRALSVVVVDNADTPVAFGMSMFITDGARERLLTAQEKRQLIWQELHLAITEAETAKGRRRTPYPVLSLREVVKAHREDGLNFLGFYGWRGNLPSAEMAQVMFLLWEAFMHLHRGYHLKSFLKEVYGERERSYYVGMGMQVYAEPSHYRQAVHKHQPYLVGITCEEVRPSARAFDLFKTPAPQVHLPLRAREVGQLASLLSLENEQIAHCLVRLDKTRRLGVSASEVRVQWWEMRRRLGGVLNGSPSKGRDGCWDYINRCPEVIYPLQIHSTFYRYPELARQYPLPLREQAPMELVRYFHEATNSHAEQTPLRYSPKERH